MGWLRGGQCDGRVAAELQLRGVVAVAACRPVSDQQCDGRVAAELQLRGWLQWSRVGQLVTVCWSRSGLWSSVDWWLLRRGRVVVTVQLEHS